MPSGTVILEPEPNATRKAPRPVITQPLRCFQRRNRGGPGAGHGLVEFSMMQGLTSSMRQRGGERERQKHKQMGSQQTNVSVCVYLCVYICVYIYIYMYTQM